MEGHNTSGRILSQMARRAAMNKLTLYVVIAVLLVMLICVWFTGGGQHPRRPVAVHTDRHRNQRWMGARRKNRGHE